MPLISCKTTKELLWRFASQIDHTGEELCVRDLCSPSLSSFQANLAVLNFCKLYRFVGCLLYIIQYDSIVLIYLNTLRLQPHMMGEVKKNIANREHQSDTFQVCGWPPSTIFQLMLCMFAYNICSSQATMDTKSRYVVRHIYTDTVWLFGYKSWIFANVKHSLLGDSRPSEAFFNSTRIQAWHANMPPVRVLWKIPTFWRGHSAIVMGKKGLDDNDCLMQLYATESESFKYFESLLWLSSSWTNGCIFISWLATWPVLPTSSSFTTYRKHPKKHHLVILQIH